MSLIALLLLSATPILDVSPTQLELQIAAGTNAPSQSVQIRNVGNGALKWTIGTPTQSWLQVSPQKGTNQGTLTLTFSTATLQPGEHEVSFVVAAQQPPAAPVNVRVVVGDAPPTAGRGPQSSIVCPANAVSILPGTSIQTVVNANVGATVFCLRTGVHALTNSITPKTSNIFVGEFGAILDGGGWTSNDGNDAAFRAVGQNIDNVTIRNLVIRNMPQNCIHARDLTDNWTVENNELTGCTYGIITRAGATWRSNKIHHNRVGGYSSYMTREFPGTTVTIENNEIAFNPPEQKAIDAGPHIVRGNWFHHNQGTGWWTDGDGNGSVIENNIVEDNGGQGLHIELAIGNLITGNTIRRNAGNGIFVSTSRDLVIRENTFDANLHAITYFIDCAAVNSFPWQPDLANNLSENNAITVGTLGTLFSSTQCTATTLAPYVNNTKQNWFRGNHYVVSDISGWFWNWNGSKNWSEWQALGHDTTGTVVAK